MPECKNALHIGSESNLLACILSQAFSWENGAKWQKTALLRQSETQGGLSLVVVFILRPLSRQQASSMSLKEKQRKLSLRRVSPSEAIK